MAACLGSVGSNPRGARFGTSRLAKNACLNSGSRTALKHQALRCMSQGTICMQLWHTLRAMQVTDPVFCFAGGGSSALLLLSLERQCMTAQRAELKHFINS